eukprot:3698158-Rhodomonas_salina.1
MHLFMYCVCPDSEVRTATKQALGDRLTRITTALREIYKGPQATQHAVEWADQFNTTFTSACAGLKKGNISYFKTPSDKDRILRSDVQHMTTHASKPLDYDLQTIFALIAAKRVFCGAPRFDNGGLPGVTNDTDVVPCTNSFGLSLLSRKYAYLNATGNVTLDQLRKGRYLLLLHNGTTKRYWFVEETSYSTDRGLLFPVFNNNGNPVIVTYTAKPYDRNTGINPFVLDECQTQFTVDASHMMKASKFPRPDRCSERYIKDDIQGALYYNGTDVWVVSETYGDSSEPKLAYRTMLHMGMTMCYGDGVPWDDIYPNSDFKRHDEIGT